MKKCVAVSREWSQFSKCPLICPFLGPNIPNVNRLFPPLKIGAPMIGSMMWPYTREERGNRVLETQDSPRMSLTRPRGLICPHGRSTAVKSELIRTCKLLSFSLSGVRCICSIMVARGQRGLSGRRNSTVPDDQRSLLHLATSLHSAYYAVVYKKRTKN